GGQTPTVKTESSSSTRASTSRSNSTVPIYVHLPISAPGTPLSTSPSLPQEHQNRHPMVTRLKAGILKPRSLIGVVEEKEPSSLHEALESENWKEAMKSEYAALMKNKTWFLTSPPQRKNIVGCRWVSKIKRDVHGNVSRYKARLVAQGFSQAKGFDFQETFSPFVKHTTIRVFLTITTTLNWKVRQLDINNAFLNGELSESIYIQQPPGFEQESEVPLVCKLTKSIYGLKQASRAWFLKVKSTLQNLGFSCSRADNSLFFRITKAAAIYLLIYVDDILITGSDEREVNKFI
ncbi:cysteine-rich RLK (RECEPTOR-like protein kinase) 8, partial [Striga hermonthica]